MIITIDTEKKEVYLTETITLAELANFKIESLSDFTIVPKVEKTIVEKCNSCIFNRPNKPKTVYRQPTLLRQTQPFITVPEQENPFFNPTWKPIPPITCEKPKTLK